MEYHFKIHREGKGYWAECLELEGCRTQGKTSKALHKNMADALNGYLDEPESSKVVFPLPNRTNVRKRNVRAVPVDPQIAFAFLLRRHRLLRKWTQKNVAEKLNVGLYSYQRLESSKTANPTLSTIVKLHRIFPELPLQKLVA
jgi:antitoxin HicB